jgi:hypothetical protein
MKLEIVKSRLGGIFKTLTHFIIRFLKLPLNVQFYAEFGKYSPLRFLNQAHQRHANFTNQTFVDQNHDHVFLPDD